MNNLFYIEKGSRFLILFNVFSNYLVSTSLPTLLHQSNKEVEFLPLGVLKNIEDQRRKTGDQQENRKSVNICQVWFQFIEPQKSYGFQVVVNKDNVIEEPCSKGFLVISARRKQTKFQKSAFLLVNHQILMWW